MLSTEKHESESPLLLSLVLSTGLGLDLTELLAIGEQDVHVLVERCKVW